ncbi:uncharacterized protein LOC121739335 [Aricia agestis]|uniref:uncharacterized protein LOC121739335 n=1 Tax=Aricia agestis TaxID=91739 RepID=UPI001C20A296|nr:uncharacterized protein LOC121739335 [Aricia agestis]
MSSEFIHNFLNKIHPNSAERHSDSSDFEIPSKYFRVAAKIAIHTTKAKRENKKMKKGDIGVCNEHVRTQYWNSENNPLDMPKSFERRSRKHKCMEANECSNDLSLYISETPSNHYVKRSHGEIDIIRDLSNVNHEKPEKLVCSSEETEVVNPSNNSNRHNKCTNSNGLDKFKICKSQADRSGIVQQKNRGKLVWHPKKVKKVGKDHGSYTIRPIYVIERIEHNNKSVTSSEEETSAQTAALCISSRSISFAESEQEIFKRSYRVLSSAVSKQNDVPNKSINKENNGSDSTKSAQYNLKRNLSTPDHMSPTYKSKSVLTDLKTTSKLTSSSSAFWNFLSDKVHRKRKMCPCDAHISCIQDILENSKPVPDIQKSTNETTLSDVKISKINQTEFLGRDKDCQCDYGPTKLEILSDINKSEIKEPRELNKTKSQRKHEAIAKALSEKYNGEILCIHSPPCVLLNGCLNMGSKQSGHSQFWPVMTKRRVAFGHKSKKVKRSKEKYEQCTYQPSFTKLGECLPEFKIENKQAKRSPCQVFHFHGAKSFKMKNPKKEARDSLNILKDVNSSEQNMNTKIPVCSKVYVVVNTNENSSARAICTHKPPCLMIPRCLARFITNNYVQVSSVPDCTHVPYCEKIPACFGQRVKNDTRSKHSKSACRIV